MLNIAQLIAATVGTQNKPSNGASTSGNVRVQIDACRLACRVQLSGIGVFTIRSHAPKLRIPSNVNQMPPSKLRIVNEKLTNLGYPINHPSFVPSFAVRQL